MAQEKTAKNIYCYSKKETPQLLVQCTHGCRAFIKTLTLVNGDGLMALNFYQASTIVNNDFFQFFKGGIMGVFGDWAEKYFDMGINVIPIVENKKPPSKFTFKKWLDTRQTEQEIEDLIKFYGQCPGIAIICGKVSGISAFDFDYKFKDGELPPEITEKKYNLDFTKIDSEFKKHLPEWTLAKKAKHGWTVFFKWSPNHYTIPADRNKVRLFDFKASGYVVIPPSFHSFDSGKEVYYSWVCGDPMEDFSCLPEVEISLIEDFKEAYSHKGKVIGGRHGDIFKYAAELVRIEPNDSVIAEKIIKYDQLKNGASKKGPYFNDQDHVKGNKKDFAFKWVERIRSFVESKPANEKGKISGKNAWDHFIESTVGDLRKDILSKKLFYRKTPKSDWDQIDNIEKVLKSYAQSKGLNKSDVADEVARYCFEKAQESFLCDFEKWDGKDRLNEIAKCIESPAFSASELREILLHWGTGIFSRVDSGGESQNRCLILKGDQGLGKDYLVRELLKSFKPYYEVVSPPDNKKDWFEIVSRIYVAHIEEFDQTSNTSVALLKSLITQESVFFRESYGKAPAKNRTAISFISTVNPDNFFRDQTGNRRYIVVPVLGINRNYPKGESAQIMAQFKDTFEKQGHFLLSQDIEAKIKRIVDALTPDRTDVEIEQLWVARSKAIIEGRLQGIAKKEEELFLLSQDAASPIILDIAHQTDVRPKTVRNILKAKGYQRRKNNGRFWAPEPQNLYIEFGKNNLSMSH